MTRISLNVQLFIGGESKKLLLVIVMEAMKSQVMFQVWKSESEAVVVILRLDV
jgi:hypothetical protein